MKILFIYVIISLTFAYMLKHQLDILKLIPIKADVKMRNKINKKKEQLKYYIKLCPVWPMLLIKEVYDEVQSRRQS